jgi:branched-chain amino acid transport system ATP-binding protein
MALMTRPYLILLDAPTIGLARIVIESLFRSLDRIGSEGVSLLIVEQNAAKALARSHRAYVLETGRNLHDGISAELLRDPLIRRMYLGA